MKKHHALFLFAVVALSIAPAVSAATCTSLTRELAYGSNDKTAGGEVLKLQNYLKDAGYLSVAPNGNFGPSTQAAVKAFQSANGIPATGNVGPLTRLAVQVRSCSSAPSSVDTSAQTSSSQSQSSQGSSATQSGSGITSPKAGDRLMIGQTVSVSWTSSDASQGIVLKSSDGVAQGYIRANGVGPHATSWKVGSVYSSRTQSDVTVGPGRYRIEVRGTASSEEMSGYFTIEAQPLSVKSLMPFRLPADGESSGVIYGAGFTSSSTVYLGDSYRQAAIKLYVSPDQKTLVFAIPQGVESGSYSVIVDNGYGSRTAAGDITVAP